MVPTANQARTSAAIGAAGAAVLAALLLAPSNPQCALGTETSPIISAKLVTAKLRPELSEQDIAVTIRMPGITGELARPPLSLAVVIDRSGSMGGTPIQNAKRAAAELVDQLRPEDAFAIVTYSSTDELVMPIGRASDAAKQAAHAAIDKIFDDGGTCISCGLTRGAAELARSPVAGGLHRMVLISDGQANEGIWDRDELAQLASDTAARGVSISSVGVGLDFDEVTMIRLAEVGHGHYYFVEDTAKLAAMFAAELGGLADTVATDVRLVVDPARGTSIDSAYGYPLTYGEGREASATIPIADLRAGETRKVVLHVHVQPAASGASPIAHFALDWRSPQDGAPGHAGTDLVAETTTDARAIAASLDRDALAAVEEARSARVLEEAATTYDKQGYEAAQRVIERHMRDLRTKNVSPASIEKIEKAANEAIDTFANQPAEKVHKVTRTSAYELAR
jgi:Ca-activated chloride channel family protein